MLWILKTIHSKYWMKKINTKILHIKPSGEDVPGEDRSTDIPTSAPYMDLQMSGELDKLMVRKEYEILYDWLETQAPKRKGAVVRGQPGIGKLSSSILFAAYNTLLLHKRPSSSTTRPQVVERFGD